MIWWLLVHVTDFKKFSVTQLYYMITRYLIMAFPKSPKKWARVFARIALKASRFNEITSNLFYSNPCNKTQLLY